MEKIVYKAKETIEREDGTFAAMKNQVWDKNEFTTIPRFFKRTREEIVEDVAGFIAMDDVDAVKIVREGGGNYSIWYRNKNEKCPV